MIGYVERTSIIVRLYLDYDLSSQSSQFSRTNRYTTHNITLHGIADSLIRENLFNLFTTVIVK